MEDPKSDQPSHKDDSPSGEGSSPLASPAHRPSLKKRASFKLQSSMRAVLSIAEEESVRYGRCIHPLAEELGMTHQEFLWTPKSSLSNEEMNQALELWGLERPDLILNFVGPKFPDLITPEMLRHEDLQAKVKDLQAAHASVQRFIQSDKSDAEQLLQSTDGASPSDEYVLRILRQELEANLIEAFVSLLAACQNSKSWIIMKYDHMEVPDFFLHEALRQSPYRPVIIAMVDRKQFCDKQRVTLESLKQGTQKLHKGDGKRLQNLPVSRVEIEVPGNSLIHEGKLWSDWVSPYASHYIFADSSEPYPHEQLGATANLFISGGIGTGNRIMESLSSKEPCVMFLHTGRACDFYGTAALAMDQPEDKRPNTVSQLLDAMNKMYPFWTGNINDEASGVFVQNALYNYIPSDDVVDKASCVFHCYNKDPCQFASSNVTFNVWAMDPYTVLSRLSLCFSAQLYHKNPLDGGGEEADEETIMMAWNMHDTLTSNCAFYFARINVLRVTSIALAVLTTIVAVCLTYADSNKNRSWMKAFYSSPYERAFEIVMIIFPAFGGLAIEFLNRFHYLTIWGTMHATKTQIESAIYRYRTRTGIYAEHRSVHAEQKESGEQDKLSSNSKRALEARDLFAKNVAAAYSVVIRFGLQDSSLVAAENNDRVLSRLVTEDTASKSPLTKDVEAGEGTQYGTWAWSIEKYSKLDGEAYLQKRFKPIYEHIQAEAPRLAGRLHAYETAVLIFTIISTVLATLNMTLWIPIPVALAGGFASLMQFEALQSRVAAINTSIDELTRFMAHWASLTIVQKRSSKVATAMVDVLEAAVLREANVYVSGSGLLQTTKTDGEDKDEDGSVEDGTHVTKKGNKSTNKIGQSPKG